MASAATDDSEVDEAWLGLLGPALAVHCAAGAPFYETVRYVPPGEVLLAVLDLDDAAFGDYRHWAVQGALRFRLAGMGEKACVELLQRLSGCRPGRIPFVVTTRVATSAAAMVAALISAAKAQGQPVVEWIVPDDGDASCKPLERAFALVAPRRPGARLVTNRAAPAVVFTDGSCLGNGCASAAATYAAVAAGAHFEGTVIRGTVAPFEYALADERAPERGIREVREKAATPSNNRGELLGVIYGLLMLLRGRALGPVAIVSDSQIAISTLREWLPARLARGTERQLKNYDLIAIAWRLLGALREQAMEVELVHVRGHQRAPGPAASERERIFFDGNRLADKHAADAHGGAAVVVIGESALATLRALAR